MLSIKMSHSITKNNEFIKFTLKLQFIQQTTYIVCAYVQLKRNFHSTIQESATRLFFYEERHFSIVFIPATPNQARHEPKIWIYHCSIVNMCSGISSSFMLLSLSWFFYQVYKGFQFFFQKFNGSLLQNKKLFSCYMKQSRHLQT